MSRNRIPLFRLLVRIILFLALINQSDNGFFEVSVDQTRILRDLQVLGGFRDILASLLLLGLFSNECYRGAWPPAKKRCRCTQASWDSDWAAKRTSQRFFSRGKFRNLRPFHIPNRQKMLETREMVDVTHVFPGNSGWTGDDVRAQASPVKACFFFLLVEWLALIVLHDFGRHCCWAAGTRMERFMDEVIAVQTEKFPTLWTGIRLTRRENSPWIVDPFTEFAHPQQYAPR